MFLSSQHKHETFPEVARNEFLGSCDEQLSFLREAYLSPMRRASSLCIQIC